MLSLIEQIQLSRQAAAASDLFGQGPWADGLVNGVHMDVVALALWPAALSRLGRPEEEAEAALAAALAAAEACPHPPTRCCALLRLGCERLGVAGGRARGVALAERAAELAANHGLASCSRSDSDPPPPRPTTPLTFTALVRPTRRHAQACCGPGGQGPLGGRAPPR